MVNPNCKPYTLHPDAEKVFKQSISTDFQLKKVYTGLIWLITNDYRNGTHIKYNYYVIKSSERLPKWHKEKMDLKNMPVISIMYSVNDKIVIEGIVVSDN